MIPRSLKRIPNITAERLIKRHTKAGTGQWEYPDKVGDFVYHTGKGYYMIRKNFNNTYEKGKVCL